MKKEKKKKNLKRIINITKGINYCFIITMLGNISYLSNSFFNNSISGIWFSIMSGIINFSLLRFSIEKSKSYEEEYNIILQQEINPLNNDTTIKKYKETTKTQINSPNKPIKPINHSHDNEKNYNKSSKTLKL